MNRNRKGNGPADKGNFSNRKKSGSNASFKKGADKERSSDFSNKKSFKKSSDRTEEKKFSSGPKKFSKGQAEKRGGKPFSKDNSEFGNKKTFRKKSSEEFGEKKFSSSPAKKFSKGPQGEKRTGKPFTKGKPGESGDKKSFRKKSSEGFEEKKFSKSTLGEKRTGKPFSQGKPGDFVGKKTFRKKSTEGFEEKKFSESESGKRTSKSYSERSGDKARKGKKELFKPFSKEKPSEVVRRKVLKNIEALPNVSEAPVYNIKVPKSAKKSSVPKASDDDKIRLNKFISNAGVCSRRDADILIQAGEVTVNGKVITELGYKVDRSDIIKYSGQLLKAEKLVYVLLNKPKDFITTTDDPEERHTVMALVKTACKERIYPVGRLDRNTTGLLLLTNDGELAKKLTHPSHKIVKVYQADLDKPITKDDFDKIIAGLELEDGPVSVDSLAVVSPDKKSLGLEIHEGRNRIVRRIFEHLGYEVVKLDRVTYAGLTKKDLPRGKWRYLSEKEVIQLKYFL